MISLDLVQLSSLRPYFSLQSVSFRAVVVWLCSVRILLFKPIGFNVFQILNLKRCQNQKLSEGGVNLRTGMFRRKAGCMEGCPPCSPSGTRDSGRENSPVERATEPF